MGVCAIKASALEDYLAKCKIEVNKPGDIIRIKSKHDPNGRGQRKFKKAFKEIQQRNEKQQQESNQSNPCEESKE
jgi:hypothetical protein